MADGPLVHPGARSRSGPRRSAAPAMLPCGGRKRATSISVRSGLEEGWEPQWHRAQLRSRPPERDGPARPGSRAATRDDVHPMSVATGDRVELCEVSKRYGDQPVLDRVTLAIEQGEFVAVVGRSGSGKSTLLRLLGALEAPDSGVVRVAGHDLAGLSEQARARLRRKTLGFVFQFFNLIPTLTVAENVELPLALNGVERHDARRRSLELLGELGLEHCAPRFPEEVSGGEQQRAAIARAVIHEPALVLADEPTGNLDIETADHVLAMLRETCRKRAATLIMATHGREVAALADRVFAIRMGRIEERAP